MVGTLLARGLLVGLVAGLLAFGFAKMFGEPSVDRAIAFESQMEQMKHDTHSRDPQAKEETEEPELVSREIQSSVGLFTGIVVYAAAFGGLFALIFAYAQGRVGRMGPRALAGLLALAGFVAIILVPDIKYPANPPSVGNAETIGYRTEMFFLMILVSIAAMVFAIQVGRALLARRGAWNAALIGGAIFILIIAVTQLLLPEINEVPDGFPAVLLWRFRVAALGIQMVIWSTIGLGFGWLTERGLRDRFGFAAPAGSRR